MASCEQRQLDILADQRGRLDASAREELRGHLATCAACAAFATAERSLTEALERQLPVHAASLSLKRRLAARWLAEAAPAPRPRPRPWKPWAAAAVAVAVLGAAAVVARPPARNELVAEAINDHLRLLDGERPLEVRSTDLHQVKPYFAGRVEFGPAIAFTGDDDFALEGGAVSRFLDAKAASLVFRRRQHKISLFIMPASDPGWDARRAVQVTSARGFTVLLWRRGDLGYALVSDLGQDELLDLERRITAAH
jgi:anti-sigma factor RsiW